MSHYGCTNTHPVGRGRLEQALKSVMMINMKNSDQQIKGVRRRRCNMFSQYLYMN